MKRFSSSSCSSIRPVRSVNDFSNFLFAVDDELFIVPFILYCWSSSSLLVYCGCCWLFSVCSFCPVSRLNFTGILMRRFCMLIMAVLFPNSVPFSVALVLM